LQIWKPSAHKTLFITSQLSLLYKHLLLQELITCELARALRSFFTATTHLLHAIPDLAALTTAEVQAMLTEGCAEEVRSVFVLGSGFVNSGSGGGSGTNTSVDLHMEDETVTSGSGGSIIPNITCDIIRDTLHHLVTTNTTISTSSTSTNAANTTNTNTSINSKTKSSPYGMLVHATRTTLSQYAHHTNTTPSKTTNTTNTSTDTITTTSTNHTIQVLVVLAGLNIVRKLFYEAQVRLLYTYDDAGI